MTRTFPWMAVLAFAVAQAKGQDLVISDLHLAPTLAWQGSNSQLFAVQRTGSTTDDWQTVDFVSVSNTGTQKWADPDPAAETPFSYRVELIPEPNEAFADGFETDGGWIDQLVPAWTSRVASGTWSGFRCYSVDNPSYAHESGRCVGMSSTSSAYLELPRVDHPTQIVYWARVLNPGNELGLAVETYEGRKRSVASRAYVSSTNYARICVPLTPSTISPRVRVKLNGGISGSTIFIDDVQIFAQ